MSIYGKEATRFYPLCTKKLLHECAKSKERKAPLLVEMGDVQSKKDVSMGTVLIDNL